MNAFVSCETMNGENKYECSRCNKKVDAQKTCAIETAPRILMVDFVRYGLGRKCTDIIAYPKKINLKYYMSTAIDSRAGAIKQTEVDDIIYELYGVILHIGGNTQGGHYTCYVRGFEHPDCWYLCNDDKVKK